MSFPRYPKYKDSGVEWLGQVPEQWEVRKVRWLFKINKRIAGDLGFDVFSITQQGIRVKDLESNDGQISMDYSKYQLVEVGDFAMNHMDLLTGGVDIAATRGVTSPDYRVVTIRDYSTCQDRFFLRLFQMCYRNKIFYGFGQGSSQLGRWRMPTEQFVDFVFPLPSLAEQTRIAAFLDQETAKIDELVAEQRRLMELLKEKRQAVISHAVTCGLNPAASLKPSGIEWLGDVPAHWELRRLRQISPRLAGRLVVQPHLYFEDEGVPIVFGNNIRRGRICQDEIKYISFEADRRFASCKVASGDLLTVRVGEPGATAVVPLELDGCHFASTMLIRQAPTFDSNWLCHVMNSDLIDSQIALVNYGAAQEQFNIGDAANFMIPFPPRNEQTELASFLESSTGAHDALIDEAQRAIDLLQERRTALISAAVTGQIDVRQSIPLAAQSAAVC